MRVRVIISSIGAILKYIGLALLMPIVFALIYKEYGSILPFVVASATTLLLGFLLNIKKVSEKEINDMSKVEALSLVFFSWVFFGLVCTIPYFFYGLTPLNALFESISGVTATGATILTDFSLYPKTFFIFRALTNWFGGMGIIVLFIAILPKFSVAGRQMFIAEVPGFVEEKITPRIRYTATWLWAIYIAFTLIEILLLKFVGKLSFYHAICTSFSSLATGGFLPVAGGLQDYGSNIVTIIVMIFVFLGGMGFVLHYKVLIQRRVSALFKSEEFHAYLGIITIFGFLIALTLFLDNNMNPLQALIDGTFQSVSMVTTTAFASTDFTAWNIYSKILFFALFFIGGCVGSTSGGIKIMRWIFVFKYLKREISKIVHPQGVFPIKLEGMVVGKEIYLQLIAFLFFYFAIFGISVFTTALIEKNQTVAIVGSIATIGNIGTGFGLIGPAAGFGALAPVTKLIFMFNMLVGRLELVPFLALLHPDVWTKRG